MASPAAPSSAMTVMMSPAETLYCLPPVLITANIVFPHVRFQLKRLERRRPASWQLDLLDLLGFGLSAGRAKEKRGETAAPKQTSS